MSLVILKQTLYKYSTPKIPVTFFVNDYFHNIGYLYLHLYNMCIHTCICISVINIFLYEDALNP